MAIFLFFLLLTLLGLVLEKRRNDACLGSFMAVIHVNGTRGKTSTCRLLDAALRQKYRVFTKTTGTDPRIINVLNQEIPVRRLGPANLHEQIRIIRQAAKEGAQILVLECMAVSPELQAASQDQIVKSGITVITNVRYDHVLDMGGSLEAIAAALSATVPRGGTLYTAEERAEEFFGPVCRARGSKLVRCPSTGSKEENLALARAVSADLGITEDQFQAGLASVREDFGASRAYPMRNRAGESFTFLNLFSVNDPLSTMASVLENWRPGQPLWFFYNHRDDRPDRALLFAKRFFPRFQDRPLLVAGPGAALAVRLFRKAGVASVSHLGRGAPLPEIPAGALLVGVGNIRGAGRKMIQSLEKGDAQL